MENDQERRITREQLERYRTAVIAAVRSVDVPDLGQTRMAAIGEDRKSTRLNSSH